MNKPNIFRWATSELTQDAFICWLLSWTRMKDESPLYDTAIYFLKKLTDNEIDKIDSIDIHKQYKNINIMVEVNKETAIIIEDKTNTKNHSNQLKTYYQTILKHFEKDKIYPVYFKTGDQANYDGIRKLRYKTFLRKDFLDVLEFGIKQGVQSDIFNDFHHYLTEIENAFNRYKTLPINQWNAKSWQGFYTELGSRLKDGYWDYVPQKNGGFTGFWWFHRSSAFNGTQYDYYLQLEEKKFCFKIHPYNSAKANEIRAHFRSKLYPKAKEFGIEIYQNGRIGKWMTVAALKESYLKTDENGVVNMDETVKGLKRVEAMMRDL